jgi:hypothetical protein
MFITIRSEIRSTHHIAPNSSAPAPATTAASKRKTCARRQQALTYSSR